MLLLRLVDCVTIGSDGGNGVYELAAGVDLT